MKGEKKGEAGKRRGMGSEGKGRGYEVGGESDEERCQQSQTKLKGSRVGLLRRERRKSGGRAKSGAEKSPALPFLAKQKLSRVTGLWTSIWDR